MLGGPTERNWVSLQKIIAWNSEVKTKDIKKFKWDRQAVVSDDYLLSVGFVN